MAIRLYKHIASKSNITTTIASIVGDYQFLIFKPIVKLMKTNQTQNPQKTLENFVNQRYKIKKIYEISLNSTNFQLLEILSKHRKRKKEKEKALKTLINTRLDNKTTPNY
jgi:hypothetical protein